ncbi:GMC oxidoreductase [Trametes meyenii]|nr:GMC oxidoreductase [Trametes meyenii]
MGGAQSHTIIDPLVYASETTSNDPAKWRKYDYIIVGGGSAGCVLAARLSEDRNATVLLLEAGKSHKGDLPTRIPLLFSKIYRTPTDWGLHTVAQAGLQDREAYFPRGKILGGTSATNALMYHHCPPEDFDEWTSLGATGWSYTELKPYFKKAEKYNQNPKFPGVDLEARGLDGVWQTSHPSEVAPIDDYVIDACKTLGMPYSEDINTAKGTMGVTRFTGNIDSTGQRSSTATAYLTDDVLSRPNLTVAINVMVEKILFDTSGPKPRAVGVELSISPTSPRYRVAASREIILSAGAIGTPQILLLSGVGPAEELHKHDIPVVHELRAVGRNFADHVSTGPLPFRAKPGFTYDYITNKLSGVIALLKWFTLGTGPLSSMGWPSAAFVRSTDPRMPFSRSEDTPPPPVKDLTSGPGAPDIELVWFPLTVFDDRFAKPPPGTSGLTLAAIILRPESRGTVVLKSRSAWDAPLIDPNCLAMESDMNVLIRGARLLMHLARTEPLASVLDLGPHSDDKTSPWWLGDADPEKISDKELEDLLRGSALPAKHPVCTVRMGASPETSAVDSELRVHGIVGLRVMDASVFPAPLSGHPCAVIVAMAEKAADMLKREMRSA